MRCKEPVQVAVRVMKITGKAYGVTANKFGARQDFWLPFSQIIEDGFEEGRGQQMCDMTIPRWLAESRGLKYEEIG